MNVLILSGRLGADPDMRLTPSGTAIVTFSLAVKKLVKRPDGKYENETEWFRLTAFGGTAEYINRWIEKGDFVEIRGAISPNVWEDDSGTTHYGMNLYVHSIDRIIRNGNNENTEYDDDDDDDYDEYDDDELEDYEEEEEGEYGF